MGDFYFDPNNTESYNLDFPVDNFRQNSFMDAMGGIGNDYSQLMNLTKPGPATTDFLSLLQQMPQREDYGPNLAQKIAALVSGASYGVLGKPELGNKTGMDILEQPFNRALEQYNRQAQALAQGANIEQGQQKGVMGLLPDLLKMRESGLEFNINAGQRDRQINLDERKATDAIAQADLDRKLKEKAIGIDEYQAETQRINAGNQSKGLESEIGLRNAQADFYKDRDRQPSQPHIDSADLKKTQLMAELMRNPILSPLLKRDSNNKLYFDESKLATTPGAIAQWEFLHKKYGLMR